MSSAEAWLAGLDKLGWRFGLERVRRLCDLLGMPQNRFASIHVVGSNGKSSVAQMTAALLEEEGLRTGAYISPHLERWSQRVQLRGSEIESERFAAAVAQTREAAEVAERSFEPGERVTQFEAATAAAFVALAGARVDVGVIEAGLGGRLDATNVIPSRLTVLTSVSLEHTDLLGETEEEIAAEKLAVLRDHSALVLGAVGSSVEKIAEATAVERSARLVRVAAVDAQVPEAVVGPYQRRNFAVAVAAAAEFLGRAPEQSSLERVAGRLRLPARLEVVDSDPPLIFDAAHNAAGVEALAEALPDVSRGLPVICVLAALADKPAAEIVAPLAPACELAVCTQIPPGALVGAGRPGARSHPAETLADAYREAGGEARAEPDPRQALSLAQQLARDRGAAVLVAGSFYLLGVLRSSG